MEQEKKRNSYALQGKKENKMVNKKFECEECKKNIPLTTFIVDGLCDECYKKDDKKICECGHIKEHHSFKKYKCHKSKKEKGNIYVCICKEFKEKSAYNIQKEKTKENE